MNPRKKREGVGGVEMEKKVEGRVEKSEREGGKGELEERYVRIRGREAWVREYRN